MNETRIARSVAAVFVIAAFAALAVGTGPVTAIANGQPDFAHPYVGAVVLETEDPRFPGPFPSHWFSGFLVSPRVVVTLGHGFVRAEAFNGYPPNGIPLDKIHVSFAQNFLLNRDSWVAVASYQVHTQFDGFFLECQERPDTACGEFKDTHDIAVVVLEKPVRITPATLAPIGFLDDLKRSGDQKGAKFGLVGYGQDETGAATGDRRIGYMGFHELKRFWLSVKDIGEGTGCVFDAGGPALYTVGTVEYTVGLGARFRTDNPGFCSDLIDEYRIDTDSARSFIDAAIEAGR